MAVSALVQSYHPPEAPCPVAVPDRPADSLDAVDSLEFSHVAHDEVPPVFVEGI